METHWHFFFDCKFSNQFWQSVLEWCGIRRKPYSAANEWKWVFKHLKGGGLREAICRTALCATVNELWRKRNARIFTGNYRSRNQVLWTIINEVQIRFMDLQISAHDNQRNREASTRIQATVKFKPPTVKTCKWEPPDEDNIMLNTDGRLTKERGSYAGILRQRDGSVVMAYHGGSKTTYIGAIEIEAIQKGLEVALELKIKNIHVRTDSMEVVNCILGICTPTWRTKAMVNSINVKIGTMEGFNIKHTFRESNKAADWPLTQQVVNHPFFWNSETRLLFYRDASDMLELEDRENDSDILKALENVVPTALGGNWDPTMEATFISNIGRCRRYKFDSMRDLLRAIRNKLNHYIELPKEIQEILRPVPDGFNGYFAGRFPRFLIEVYKICYKFCKEEEWFIKYFNNSVL
ncbi:Serine/threonine-protein kinase/endoribonuclease IRE1 [Thalictrum thalictroides]|uniref:Serine/threonine-protein kinase/endoribonuclease IRE1 n=1 Tax=Thalictrum thalictroides TaxID=46969 RepID=A0A7J6WFB8_THATH|nr:Serine/threonine-protein kinase/endoribonuclease IRE1 [Thalictrum thalictroides]